MSQMFVKCICFKDLKLGLKKVTRNTCEKYYILNLKKEIKICWPNFSQIGSRFTDLEVKMYAQLVTISIWRKKVTIDFLQCLTCIKKNFFLLCTSSLWKHYFLLEVYCKEGSGQALFNPLKRWYLEALK